MRVAFFSDVAYVKGGAEKSLFDLLANPSVEPLLIVPGEGEMADAARQRGIPVAVLDLAAVEGVRRPFTVMKGLRVIGDAARVANSLKALARRHNAICVHSNGLKAHAVACLARLLGGAPVVAHFRSIPFTWTEKVFWRFVRLVASRMILVSRPCWNGARLPANARVVRNGITPPREDLLPHAYNAPLRLGFVGRLQFTKHTELAIEWLDYARKNGIEATLTIRGEAQADQQDYAEMLKRLVREKDLEAVCRFEGKVQGELEGIYQGIDVNLVPSKTPDPLPRSVMEAMAIGVPVIGYPAGGIPDMILDGETGYLARNEEEFLSALRRLTQSQDDYEGIRRNGLERILRDFSISALHRSVAREYQAIAGGTPQDR